MAPTTRLSGAYGNAVPNLEHILEHFDQFKRKHITQNRDIIKTNALAQLRIRELEAKVQALEGERAAQSLETLRFKAALARVERAAEYMTRGWQEMGKGLVQVTQAQRTDEHALDTAAKSHAAYVRLAQADPLFAVPLYKDDDASAAHQRRISIDSTVLPAGVVRSIARAPEVQILDVPEEQEETASSYANSEPDADYTIRAGWGDASSLLRSSKATASFESTRPPSNMPEPTLLDADGAPSPLPSPSLDADGAGVFAFLEHSQSLPRPAAHAPVMAPATQASSSQLGRTKEQASRNAPDTNSSASRSATSRQSQTARLLKARRSGRHQVSSDSSTTHASSTPPEEVTDSEPERQLSHARSIDSLSSYVDEEIQVSDDDDTYAEATPPDEREGTLDPAKQLERASQDATGSTSTPTLSSVKKAKGRANAALGDASSYKVKPTESNRKRKVPVSPIERDHTVSMRARASANESTDLLSAEDESSSSRSRRTSARARSSVNYALPKLNTKMRKPDPVDLIPVANNSTTSSSTAIGGDADAAMGSSTPHTQRRGVTGAASTGNLSDIRRQHQTAAAEREASAARENGGDEDDADTPGRRREVAASELSALEADSGAEVERIATPALSQGPWRRTSVISRVVPLQGQSSSDVNDATAQQEPSSASTSVGRAADSSADTSARPPVPDRSSVSAHLTLQDLGFSGEELDPLPPARPRLQPGASTSKASGMTSRPRSASCEGTLVSTGSTKAAKSRPGSSATPSQAPNERPRTYSGASSKALASSVQGNGVLSLGRAGASAESKQRTSLHAALTATNGQVRRQGQSIKGTDASAQTGRREMQ